MVYAIDVLCISRSVPILSRIRSGVGKLIADGMYQYDIYHEVPTIGIAAWGSVSPVYSVSLRFGQAVGSLDRLALRCVAAHTVALSRSLLH